MKVHYLNCGTMRPRGARQLLPRLAEVPSLCLLIEGAGGLVLIDAGIGTLDVEDSGRLGFSNRLLNAVPDPGLPAVRQVASLGFDPGDVIDVVCTHLDRDHAGGLSDFPHARVHLHAVELDAALRPAGRRESERYRNCHFAHGPAWVPHERLSSEPWFGLDCIREDSGLPAGIVLVPLAGHTRGHCGVAVETSGGWILHCGDAYYLQDELKGRNHACAGVRVFRRVAHLDSEKALRQLDRINDALAAGGGDVTPLSSHDPSGLDLV